MPFTYPVKITTTEMHTGGGPLRIIESGLPNIEGRTILEKIRFMRKNLDEYRKLLIFEPRGHFDMYGMLVVSPDMENTDFGAIFIHNEGYSSMCGHAVISLGRYAIEKGLVKNPTCPETKMVIQCPCGPIDAFVEYDGTKTGSVRFHSVPSFVFATDIAVDVPNYGNIVVDIVFGGAFYAIVSAKQYGLDIKTSTSEQMRSAAGETTDALKKQLKLKHPEHDDLAFLYGTILTDGKDDFSEDITDTVCVYAERAVDRSPCGSGTTSRIALQFHKNQLPMGKERTFRGPAGFTFTAKVERQVSYGGYEKAVVVEVKGKGHYAGSATFTLEEDDVIGAGFLI